MSQYTIDDLAAVIRRHPNTVDTNVLATAIAIHLTPGEPECAGCTEVVAETIDSVNPERTMGAGRLAEAIWNDLVADDERRLADEVLAENLDHLAGY